jgi:hypothetical protein
MRQLIDGSTKLLIHEYSTMHLTKRCLSYDGDICVLQLALVNRVIYTLLRNLHNSCKPVLSVLVMQVA